MAAGVVSTVKSPDQCCLLFMAMSDIRLVCAVIRTYSSHSIIPPTILFDRYIAIQPPPDIHILASLPAMSPPLVCWASQYCSVARADESDSRRVIRKAGRTFCTHFWLRMPSAADGPEPTLLITLLCSLSKLEGIKLTNFGACNQYRRLEGPC